MIVFYMKLYMVIYLICNVKRNGLNCVQSVPFWRSGWDSNPRAVARKLISSQPRYDLFDTAPYNIKLISNQRAILYHISIQFSRGFAKNLEKIIYLL